ncbi:MAG: hypothetical protein GY757_52315 [bacterium]|nr:hypothetical protein [bacterium]
MKSIKKGRFEKKLELNKVTIAALDINELSKVRGGSVASTPIDTCIIGSFNPICRTIKP